MNNESNVTTEIEWKRLTKSGEWEHWKRDHHSNYSWNWSRQRSDTWSEVNGKTYRTVHFIRLTVTTYSVTVLVIIYDSQARDILLWDQIHHLQNAVHTNIKIRHNKWHTYNHTSVVVFLNTIHSALRNKCIRSNLGDFMIIQGIKAISNVDWTVNM